MGITSPSPLESSTASVISTLCQIGTRARTTSAASFRHRHPPSQALRDQPLANTQLPQSYLARCVLNILASHPIQRSRRDEDVQPKIY
jgi:hypothetical protein